MSARVLLFPLLAASVTETQPDGYTNICALCLPGSINVEQDGVALSRVRGDSLMGDGIVDSDLVLWRRRFDRAELWPGRICVVETPEGLLVKHLFLTIKGMRLVSSNPEYDELEFRHDEAQIVGILIRREARDFSGVEQ